VVKGLVKKNLFVTQLSFRAVVARRWSRGIFKMKFIFVLEKFSEAKSKFSSEKTNLSQVDSCFLKRGNFVERGRGQRKPLCATAGYSLQLRRGASSGVDAVK
jgi:hypothetical protein